jgi:RNA polymerase sigma factor (sigma-70 family)
VRLSLAHRADPQAAVESLYRRYGGDVYRYALAIMGDAGDAEDVTQTAFLNAFRAIERGDQIREPKAWLRTIAHNVCRQRFRQVSRQPSQVPFDEDVGELVAEHEGPTAEDLTRALNHLPFNQRSALVMRELEGRSPREIAAALGVTLSATETLLFRARRSLREQLEGALSCRQAEQAISRQADGMLGRSERGALRAHLRECPECARAAKSIRARRGAMRSLAATPLPPALALASSFGSSTGGAVVVGGSVLGKLALGGAAAALVAGGGAAAISTHPWRPSDPHRPPAAHHAAPSAVRPAPTPMRLAPAADARPASGSANAHQRLAAKRATQVSRGTPAPSTSAGHVGTKPAHAVTKNAKEHRARAPEQHAANAPNPRAIKPSKNPKAPNAPKPHANKPPKNQNAPQAPDPRASKPSASLHETKPPMQPAPQAGAPEQAAKGAPGRPPSPRSS